MHLCNHFYLLRPFLHREVHPQLLRLEFRGAGSLSICVRDDRRHSLVVRRAEHGLSNALPLRKFPRGQPVLLEGALVRLNLARGVPSF